MTATQPTPDSPPWPAPRAAGPIDATVDVPGSKSLTNRHLVLAALAQEPTRLVGALRSRDAELMVDALREMGVGVATSDRAAGVWDVDVTPAPLHGADVDAGLAGTVMRFLPPLATLADGDVRIDGDEAARRRPLGPIVEGLRALGARIEAAGGSSNGAGSAHLPLTVRGTGSFAGGEVTVDASGSSQFVSGFLLSAPAWRDGVVVTHAGGRVPSLPHIDMTLHALRERGVDAAAADGPEGPAQIGPRRWRVAPGPVAGGEVVVEPDLSNAGVFLAAAMIAGGTVRVPRWPAMTAQPFDEVRRVFELLGGTVEGDGGVLTVRGPGVAGLRPLATDLALIGELTPTIAAMCALAQGTSRLEGVAHLRGHETDRLAAISTEITRLGGTCVETPGGLVIEGAGPGALHGAELETYEDHRMATFAALIGLAVEGVRVVDVETTAKTLPAFPDRWDRMLRGV